MGYHGWTIGYLLFFSVFTLLTLLHLLNQILVSMYVILLYCKGGSIQPLRSLGPSFLNVIFVHVAPFCHEINDQHSCLEMVPIPPQACIDFL